MELVTHNLYKMFCKAEQRVTSYKLHDLLWNPETSSGVSVYRMLPATVFLFVGLIAQPLAQLTLLLFEAFCLACEGGELASHALAGEGLAFELVDFLAELGEPVLVVVKQCLIKLSVFVHTVSLDGLLREYSRMKS